MRKLKFYMIGLIPGLIIVFFILNKKGASCSGYLPNSRVIAETLSKDFIYTPAFDAERKQINIDSIFIKDSIIAHGEVDFEKSKAQNKPCPQYYLSYPKENPQYEVTFEKCEETATFTSIKKIQ